MKFITIILFQGAAVGFGVSVVFGLWISIGAFIYPSPGKALPISIAGCVENDLLNSTLLPTTETLVTTSFVNDSMLMVDDDKDHG